MHAVQRRSLAFLLAVSVAAGGPRASPEPARPNLLLVTLDTTRADHLGSYGWPHATTPNLDGLARRGVRFERCDTAAPITLPSHASLLTGVHPPRHGVRDNGSFRLPPPATTVTELLRERGWDTGAAVSAIVVARQFGLDQGFRVFDDRLDSRQPGEGPQERTATGVTDAALAILGGLRAPFFLWVHYYDPHKDYLAPAELRQGRTGPFPDYDAEIAYVDRELGRLLAALPAATTVLVVADHGEMLGEHGEKSHGVLLHHGARRVPLLLAGPGIAAGKVVPDLVRTVDVAPTLLELAGIAPPAGLEGQSLVPLLGPGSATRIAGRITYSESLLPYFAYRWHPLRALSDGEILFVDGLSPRLYDLVADPAEQTDLAARRPAETARWQAKLAELGRSFDAEPPAEVTFRPLSSEERQALAALGYLGGGGGGGGKKPQGLLDPYAMVEVADRLAEIGEAMREDGCGEVLPELQGILRRNRDNLPALTMAGVCLMRQEAYAEALPYFEHAVAMHPEAPVPHANRAGCLLKMGRTKEAEAAYETAIELDPSNAEAVANLAVILRQHGRARAALELLARALAQTPGRAVWRVEEGLTHAALEQLAPALASFEKALELEPDNLLALENGARAAFHLGRARRAAALYRRLLTLVPERGDLWKTLGAIELEGLEDLAAARASFEHALRLEKDPAERAELEALLRELAATP